MNSKKIKCDFGSIVQDGDVFINSNDIVDMFEKVSTVYRGSSNIVDVHILMKDLTDHIISIKAKMLEKYIKEGLNK